MPTGTFFDCAHADAANGTAPAIARNARRDREGELVMPRTLARKRALTPNLQLPTPKSIGIGSWEFALEIGSWELARSRTRSSHRPGRAPGLPARDAVGEHGAEAARPGGELDRESDDEEWNR